MPHESANTVGGFGGSDLRDAITFGGVSGPQSALPANRLLAPSAANTPSQAFSGLGGQMAATQAAPAAPGSVGTPLGSLLSSVISPLTGLVRQGGESFRSGFATEASIAQRAAQLTQQNIAQFAQNNDIGIDAVTPEQIGQIQDQSMAEAQQEGQGQNEGAFGAVVGSRVLTSGINTLIVARQAKDELNNIQRAEERFINGVEFNSRLTKQASNIVEMRSRLQVMDSLMQQGSGTLAGQQQQNFFRSPTSGLQV